MNHLLIIWSRGLGEKDEILIDLKQCFQVTHQYEVNWSKDKFTDNLKVFYSLSWQRFPASKLFSALHYKCNHCGTSPFTAILFNDPHPQMGWRETTDGQKYVNTNVFDKKREYRQLTGGGHLIHCSNDDFETNRDLTLLFGLNTKDFLAHPPTSTTWQHNCIGIDGYKSIEQLFYVLNNSIDYCVLRNFECLPDEYTVEGHGDIDLLVENMQQMVCLTLASPVFNEPYRVYHTISIAGKEVPFDFRYVGDNYYDVKWESHILEHRRLDKDLFYVPSDEDLYHSLLYHAYIQKKKVKTDYLQKLQHYAMAIGKPFVADMPMVIGHLDSFMERNDYEYIQPKDITVIYNNQNLSHSVYAERNGKCVKRTEEKGNNGYIYTSRVYEKDNSYIKIGTAWLIDNECRFLKLYSGSGFFPEVLSTNHSGNGLAQLELSKIEGISFPQFYGNMNNQHSPYLRSFVCQMVQVLYLLNQQGISHRDLTPSNILIATQNKRLKVGVIDFGWAAYNKDKEARTPSHLGGRYAPNGNPSDYYALGTILMDFWPDVPYMRLIASWLFKAVQGNTDKQLNRIEKLLRFPFTPYDEFRMLLRRHQRISRFWHRIQK